MALRYLVGGSTGAVGRAVVQVAVRDPRVTAVTALSRRDISSADVGTAFGLQPEDDRSKIRVVRVAFGDLASSAEEIGPHDVCISCLGVYTADVKDLADFMAKEHTPNMELAQLCKASLGVRAYSFLSGNGAKVTEEKGFFQAMFSFVKGRVEADLGALFPGKFTSARPAFIAGRGGDRLGDKLANVVENTPIGIHCNDIAKAMVHSTMAGAGGAEQPPVLENGELKKVAAEYNARKQ